MKRRLLRELGMSETPEVSEVNISKSEMDRVLEIYHQNAQIADSEEMMGEYDTIRQFYTFRDQVPLQSKLGDDHMWKGSSRTLLFTLEFPRLKRNSTKSINVDSATLSIYVARRGFHHERKDRFDLRSGQPARATVYIYVLEERDHLLSRERSLVSAQSVVLNSDRWEVFDVTKAVKTWVAAPSQNYRLLIDCDAPDFTFLSVNNSETILSDNEKPGNIFYQKPGRAALDIQVSIRTKRKKRSIRNRKRQRSRYPLDCTTGQKTKLCCRYSMTISFKELKWHWIIEPKQFEAYFCKGKCNHNYKTYASRHARIQNLMRRQKGKRKQIPRLCCAPQKMEPLQVVYLKTRVN
ncbi:dorsalin-1-like isoform X2 [Tachypleus tridentatus]|uniref:dorsalin-1-like isoform X2 n=1 Tax=Tachypleus tridentatus TaxID=6853 RepID=UPI003FD27089